MESFDLTAPATRLCHQFLLFYFYVCMATGAPHVSTSYALTLEDNRVPSLIPSSTIDTKSSSVQRMQDAFEYFTYTDVCESHSGFEHLATGVNPDSEVVQLHPSTWVFTTRCRHAGQPCTGYDGAMTACRPKKSWVQAYGKVEGDTWQPHWIATTTSCTCAMKTFPYLPKNHF